jgi:hypothetical protein
MEVTPGAEGRVFALEGPMLYAGERGDSAREDAIVPGMEWLVRGEESSSALDFTPDHPDRVRYVTHPYKVTIPAVGMRLGESAVGLLWDVPAEQPGYALAGPVNLVFASPNRFEGYDNHLMGLSLPAVGGKMEENARRASAPLVLQAGQGLAIRAELLGVPSARDSLVAVDEWFAAHPYPAPLPYPRGDAKRELEFSLRGYFKDRALWNPAWKKWYSDLIVGFQPTDGPVGELLDGAAILGGGAVADEARALAAEATGRDARILDRWTQFRANPGAVFDAARRARALVASQAEDGTWRFGGKNAGEWPRSGVNYEVLGPVGASEVGLSANSAAVVLEAALLTGDKQLADAGLKALAAMRQFRVPRAAQVWEVPFHAPDILASAQAVQACLEAFRYDGDKRWLRDAVYWARTGLPFLYLWDDPERPYVRYASIPVFGASLWQYSWVGRPVQWNGLDFAGALLELAKYDSSQDWKRVAEGIVVSAMHQQAPDGEAVAHYQEGAGPHGSGHATAHRDPRQAAGARTRDDHG